MEPVSVHPRLPDAPAGKDFSPPPPCRLRRSRAALAASCLALAAFAPTLAAQSAYQFTTLHLFGGTAGDGLKPRGDLVKGADGRFYGTTTEGGNAGNNGTVFAITPTGAVTVVHSFTAGDGKLPTQSLVEGADGRFYGTTNAGGNTAGNGTVFAVTPAGVLTTLYLFPGGRGASNPLGGLARGADGLFYGTTDNGHVSDDNNHSGTVFTITPDGTLTTLHGFLTAIEGVDPQTTLVQGRDGRFYGTTQFGGVKGQGTVFAVTPAGVLTVLHSFAGGSDGQNPRDRLVEGSDGRFYGVTEYGGSPGIDNGVVYAVDAAGGFTILHRFTESGAEGYHPVGGLVQGRDGRFYGTTYESGTVYAMTAAGEVTVLNRFAGGTQEGAYPQGALVQDTDGSFYGTTVGGGLRDYYGEFGTVFRLSPTPAFFDGEVALSNGVYYLALPNGNPFGYYSLLSDPHYLYHFDLGYEYVFDAADGHAGVYLYDFKSGSFFYTSPSFPFPYLYDFSLNTVLYYYPDPNNPGRYNTNGMRYFYNFAAGQIISK